MDYGIGLYTFSYYKKKKKKKIKQYLIKELGQYVHVNSKISVAEMMSIEHIPDSYTDDFRFVNQCTLQVAKSISMSHDLTAYNRHIWKKIVPAIKYKG